MLTIKQKKKTKIMKHSKSLLTALTLVLTLLFSINTTAQSNEKDFTIIVEKTDDGVKMKCIKGCAWTDLAFSIHGKNAQSVDQFGMFSASSKRQTPDPKFVDFEFSVVRENNTFVLNGLKGTSWKTLNLKPTNATFFNKNGLLKVE